MSQKIQSQENQTKTKRKKRVPWMKLFHITLLKVWFAKQCSAIVTPLKSSWYSYSGGEICPYPTTSTYLAGIVERDKKVSFNIDPHDLNKIEVLPDENNVKKYQLVSRGTECFTYPYTTRYNFFGVFMEPVTDPEPDNPLTSFTCRVSKFVLPTDLVPCDPDTTYLSFEDIFYFDFTFVRMTYDEIKPKSRVRYSYGNIRKYHVINIGMESSLAPESYFNDDFMEMLVVQPFRQQDRMRLALYSRSFLRDCNIALARHNVVLTGSEYLTRITHDSLPGYYFVPDPNGDDGRFAHLQGQSSSRITKSYSYELYLSEPQNMDVSNIGVLRHRLDHRYSDLQLVRVNYEFHIKKVGSDVNIEMRRVDLADDTTVNNTISINIPLTKTDEYVHFGFSYGIAHLYYKTGTATMFLRVYETLFGWHDGSRQITSSQYDLEGPYQSVRAPWNNEISDFQYPNYNDRALTLQNTENIFGLRLIAYTFQSGAYPPTKIAKAEPNQDLADGQCMLYGIFKNRCISLAFQRKRGSSNIDYTGYDCLIPQPGYNRDLVIWREYFRSTPTYLISDFEGSSPEAIELRKDRAKFTDNLGLDYWVKCPDDCLTCNSNMDCLTCLHGDPPILKDGMMQCVCPISGCSRCTSSTYCVVCGDHKKRLIDETTPDTVTCTGGCPAEFGYASGTNGLECHRCLVDGFKSCDHRSSSKKCIACLDSDKRVIDYRISSTWIGSSHPKKDQVVCEPKTLSIDGFFTTEYDLTFKKCLTNCKSCLNQFTCEVCDNPDDNLQYYPLITQVPNLCVRCLPEESRFVNTENKCETCPTGCSRCTSQASCSQCEAGYELDGGRCLKICPDGQYRTTSNECATCPDSYCSKCASETGVCTECETGFSLRDDTKKCWKDCGVKKYADTQTTCQDCSSHCATCMVQTGQCEACDSGFTKDTSTHLCWKDCSARQFNPDQGTCSDCPLHCSACSRIDGLCDPCDSGYTLDGSNKCWKDCLAKQFNPDVSQCQDCPIHCRTCSRETGVCSECDDGYTKDDQDKCWKDCQPEEFNPDQSTCSQCPVHCKMCSRVDGICSECKPGFSKDSQDKCWKDCQPEEFNPDQSSCSQCPINCKTCSRVDGVCSECKPGHTKDGQDKCWKDCLSNEFNPDQSTCSQCPLHCKTCSRETGVCLDCDVGYTKDSQNKCWKDCQPEEFNMNQSTCTECPINCKTCSRLDGVCSECKPDHTKDGDNKCWKDCLPNKFNPDQSTCQNCPQFCTKCSRVDGICSECQSGYTKDDQNKCWKDCPVLHFNKDQDTCFQCPLYCEECSRVDGVCTKCKTGYTKDNENKCWKDCLSNEFNPDQNSCQSCPDLCPSCSRIDGICTHCDPGFTKDEQNRCWKDCSENEYNKDESTCASCPTKCSRCQRGTGACQECFEGYNLEGDLNECWKKCPQTNQYRESQTVCKDCSEFCLGCSDLTGKCKSCERGFKLQQEKSPQCKRECSTKEYWREDNTCESCVDHCEECLEITGKCSRCAEGFVYNSEKNVCDKIEKPLILQRVFYSDLHNRMEISFNQAIIIKSIESTLKVHLKDPKSPTILTEIQHKTITLDRSKSRIFIDIDFQKEGKSFEENELVVREVTPRSITAERDPRVVFEEYPITQSGVSYFNSPLTSSSVVMGGGSSVLTNLVSAGLIIGSMSTAVVMIKVFQMLSFLLFINIELPQNASRFIYSFRKNAMDYVPTVIKFGDDPGGGSEGRRRRLRAMEEVSPAETAKKSDQKFNEFCVPHRKFEEMGQTCSAFINLGSFITQLIIFVLLKFIVSCLLGAIEKIKNNVKKVRESHRVTAGFNDEEKRIMRRIRKTAQTRKNQQNRLENGSRLNSIRPNKINQKKLKDEEKLNQKIQKINRRRKNKQDRISRLTGINTFRLNLEKTPVVEQSGKKASPPVNKNKKEKKSVLKKALLKMDGFLTLAYFFNLFKAIQLKAIIGAMVSILNIDSRSRRGQANIILSLVILSFYVTLVILVSFLIFYKIKRVRHPKETPEDQQCEALITSLELFSDLKEMNEKNISAGKVLLVNLLEDLLVPLILVVFIENAAVQILLTMTVMSFSIYFIIRHWPFKENHQNILFAGNKIVYFLLLGVFLISDFAGKRMSQKARFTYVGFGVMLLVSILILLNFIVAVSVFIKKIKNKKKKETEEEEERDVADQGNKKNTQKEEGPKKSRKGKEGSKVDGRRIGDDSSMNNFLDLSSIDGVQPRRPQSPLKNFLRRNREKAQKRGKKFKKTRSSNRTIYLRKDKVENSIGQLRERI